MNSEAIKHARWAAAVAEQALDRANRAKRQAEADARIALQAFDIAKRRLHDLEDAQ